MHRHLMHLPACARGSPAGEGYVLGWGCVVEFPTLLYHGTSHTHALDALRHGIKPRGQTRAPTWSDRPSNRNCVYLTDTYPIYFAAAAAMRNNDAYAAVLEIDTAYLDPSMLRADEEVFEQTSRGKDQIAGTRLERVTHYADALQNDFQQAAGSLDAMGSCAYNDYIPPNAITRMALLQMNPPIQPVQWSSNASISVANFHFCWMEHSAITAWVMNNRWPVRDNDIDLYRFWLKSLSEYSDRIGIKVSDNPLYKPKLEIELVLPVD